MTYSNYEPPPIENSEASAHSKPESGIADLSLAVFFGVLLRHPFRTFRALGELTAPHEPEAYPYTMPDSELHGSAIAPLGLSTDTPVAVPVFPHTLTELDSSTPTRSDISAEHIPSFPSDRQGRSQEVRVSGFTIAPTAFRPFGFMIGGWVIALFAVGYALRNGVQRTVADVFPISALLGAAGMAMFVVGASQSLSFPRLPGFQAPPRRDPRQRRTFGQWLYDWSGLYGLRVALAGLSLIFTVGAYALNTDNTFTLPGVFCWFFCVVGWSVALAPEILPMHAIPYGIHWLRSLPGRVRSFRGSWTAIALLIILCVGGYFRFANLAAYPPEMTSDHVEKVLDSQNISEGYSPVFLPNNGGREIVQFYTLALIHNVVGVPIDFNLLKLLTAIEGMLGLLAAWWWGREMVGESDQELGNLTGLIMAALLAVSYWHIMLSRLGLRIVLTPMIVSLTMIYFVRALRHNRRIDYVKTGLALGVGLYMYQAVRMVPLLLIVGLILVLVVPVGAGILRRRTLNLGSPLRILIALYLRRQYLFSFAALVIVAAAVFAPLGHFMVEYPDSFWQRTSGRLFGDDTVEYVNPVTGNHDTRVADVRDHLEAFRQNIGYFGQNMVNALLMFTWKGDQAWISGEQTGSPEMDRATGALFLVGLALWLVRMVRRRDPGDWLIPFGLVIMLFATALSLAYTIEVPSATRASGAIPFAYGFAGFGGALILRQAWQLLRGNVGRVFVIGVAVLIWLFLMASANADAYVNKSMADYRLSSQPHSQGGQILRAFENRTGAPGNAFMIAYVYWWDHRAVAIDAGDLGWRDQHGIVRDNPSFPTDVVAAVEANIVGAIKASVGTRYEIHPDQEMMFFLNQSDQQVLAGLQSWLPSGSTIEHIQSYTPSQDFLVLTAPSVGCDWLNTRVGIGASAQCTATNQVAPSSHG